MDAGAVNGLPPGFVLDQPVASAAGSAALPPGFVLDKPAPAYSGGLLPLSRDASGKVSFDSNAGIVGAIKRAVMLPGDVAKGRIDPLSDEGIQRSFELAAVASPVNPAFRSGDQIIPGVLKDMRNPTKRELPPPTAEQLKGAADAGYTAAREMPVQYPGRAISEMASGLANDLNTDGILAELAPKTHGILKRLTNAPEGGFATPAGIDAARKALGHAARDFGNPTEQLAARRAIDGLDAYVGGGYQVGHAADSVVGPAAAVAKTIGDARGNYAAAKRSEKLTGVEERADFNAAVANSGQNVDNAIRQRVRDILVRPRERAGFSPEELAALEEVARGTASANTLRAVGNMLGGGLGMGAAVYGLAGAVASAVNPMAAAVSAAPAVGYLMKKGSAAITRRNLNKADEAVRARSPLYEQMVSGYGQVPMDRNQYNALLRVLTLADLAGQPVRVGQMSLSDLAQ